MSNDTNIAVFRYTGIYWDIFTFIIHYYVTLQTARSFLKTENLGKQQRKICYIPHIAWDDPAKS